ncbi:MAG: type III secretion system export apparatus subunit SctR [Myxococcales bacterium]|nr:type III secretion system export apparatus subunit SctR [Myxococcales bacterium]
MLTRRSRTLPSKPPSRRFSTCSRGGLVRSFGVLAALLLALAPRLAEAQGAAGGGGLGSRPVTVLLLLAALSILPFVLVMITSFVKIAVVLSILRNAIGTPQVPPSMVITGLAVVLSIYVMAPTASDAYDAIQKQQRPAGGAPAKKVDFISAESARSILAAASAAKEPVRAFLVKHSRQADRAMFRDLARRMWKRPGKKPHLVGDKDLLVVVPAFVVGQLALAFQIGFLIFVPFLIIDLVVGNVLLALGMHMLSPTTVSLPFKLLLFVLVDGWVLLAQGLVLSYA